MSRLTHQDVTAQKMELVTITIPANTGDGSTVDALKGTKTYDKKIVAWEVVENLAAFEVARAADMASPVLGRDLDEGFAPPVGRFALLELYLRSTTAATVGAVLILYTANEEVPE